MSAVNGSVKIESVAKPGCIDSPAPAVDTEVTARVKRGPGMCILAHHTDGQLIGDPVIEAETDSAGSKVVALGISIAIDVDKVTKAGHPDAPTIFRSMLQDWFHHRFRRFPVPVCSIL